MSQPESCPLVATTGELDEVCQHIRAAGRVAVDTEFVWERTFYPALGIVQLAVDEDRGWLLDIPALAGKLEALGKILADPGIEKIIHDARQDLTILKNATGHYPARVFDTRLAAGFVGPSASLSLNAACQKFLGRTLDKGETRSNWLKRPLSPQQCRYALYDVIFLPQLRDLIAARAREKGRAAWLEEELEIYNDPRLYDEQPPREIYTRVKGAGRLKPRELAVLRELAAWRELEARRRNRPRRHIIPDDPLISLALSQPEQVDLIKRGCGLSPRAGQRYAGKLREVIAKARKTPTAGLPASLRRNHNRNLALRARKLLDFIHDFCVGRELDPGLIGNRQEIEKLLEAPDPETSASPVLKGWRYEFIGREILKLI